MWNSPRDKQLSPALTAGGAASRSEQSQAASNIRQQGQAVVEGNSRGYLQSWTLRQLQAPSTYVSRSKVFGVRLQSADESIVLGPALSEESLMMELGESWQ